MHTIKIHIGTQQYDTEPGLRLGKELLQLAGITPPHQLAVSRAGAIDIPIGQNDYIIVQDNDHFVIGDGDLPLPDNPCLRKPIEFCLNSDLYSDDNALKHAKILGSELKRLAAGYQAGDGLFAEVSGFADEPIRDDMRIVVQHRDKFITVPCGNVGELNQKPTITPFEQQLSQVKQQFPKIELIPSSNLQLLVIKDFPLPAGWNHISVDLMIQIPNSYPLAHLDMFWVSPHITLSNGTCPERAEVKEQHCDKEWQRFSWHYLRSWSPSSDNLASHIRFCSQRLNLIK